MCFWIGRSGFIGRNAIASSRKFVLTVNGSSYDTGYSSFIGDYGVAAVVTTATAGTVACSLTCTAQNLSPGDYWNVSGSLVCISLATETKVSPS